MKTDLILAGVGGQGILSIGAIVARACIREGFRAKQSETHGMSQRGGSVVAHLRLSDEPIRSDMIPRGVADLIVSLEPLEGLRYLDYLSPRGHLVTAEDPIRNFDAYPETEKVLQAVRALPRATLVPAAALARKAGSPLAMNMVLVGSIAPYLAAEPTALEQEIRRTFARKGEKLVEINCRAFRAGLAAVSCPG